MTDQKHTKEPWELSSLIGKRVDVNGVVIDFDKPYGEEVIANANRIVACVNALTGIDDPEAFMRDVRAFMKLNRGFERMLKLEMLNEHLKGGVE